MRIVERIKDAVEHTADSWQQKLLNEYNASDEPATRARKIISELVKQLDKPNQVIINDIVSLIYALASNPDPSVDLDQVVSTAEMLIHELVEPIPNPDKKLMDELLHLVVNASAHHGKAAQQQIAPSSISAAAVNNQTISAPARESAGVISSPASQVAAAQQSQPAPSATAVSATTTSTPQAAPTQTAPKPSSSSKTVDNTMIKLIMDEMKEVIKKNQMTELRITDTENRMSGRISALTDDLQAIKEKLKKQEADLDTINKNLDKFISLYEVVINQYNPFIEHIDEPKTKESNQPVVAQATPKAAVPSQSQPIIPEQKTTLQATTGKKAQTDANAADELSFLIDEVKEMTESEFLANKAKTSNWIETVLGDSEFAKAYLGVANQQEATKLLLKKSFKLHTK